MVLAFSSTSFSQERFKFGIKGGIGFWRLNNLQNSQNMVVLLFYSYPLGISLGFYVEDKLSENFSFTEIVISK